MVVSIGLSLALRNLFQFWFGESPRPFKQYASQRGYQVGPVTMAPKDLWSIGISLLAMLAVAYLLQRTRIGKAMRAVADNPDLAASSGIDVEGVIRFVWALGAALACLGGVLFALNERVAFNTGFNLLAADVRRASRSAGSGRPTAPWWARSSSGSSSTCRRCGYRSR